MLVHINWTIYEPCPESHWCGGQEITMNGFINIIAIKTSFVINCLNLEIMRLSQGELSDKRWHARTFSSKGLVLVLSPKQCLT